MSNLNKTQWKIIFKLIGRWPCSKAKALSIGSTGEIVVVEPTVQNKDSNLMYSQFLNWKNQKVDNAVEEDSLDIKSKEQSCTSSKAEKLRPLVSDRLVLEDFYRLVDGDLSHIGDAIIEGKSVLLCGKPKDPKDLSFSVCTVNYAVAPDRIVIGDVSFPKPETEAPAVGTLYYLVTLNRSNRRYVELVWQESSEDYARLKSASVHLTKEAAIEHSEAMIKLSGGEV